MDHIQQIIIVHGIAVGLAMDAFAVSIVSGSIYKKLDIHHALRMAFFFGAFQAIMPLIGYAAGQTVAAGSKCGTTGSHSASCLLLAEKWSMKPLNLSKSKIVLRIHRILLYY